MITAGAATPTVPGSPVPRTGMGIRTVWMTRSRAWNERRPVHRPHRCDRGGMVGVVAGVAPVGAVPPLRRAPWPQHRLQHYAVGTVRKMRWHR